VSVTESNTTYLHYETLEDMLKVIVYSAQSALGLTPMLYSVKANNQHILFMQTGAVGGTTIHYVSYINEPSKKFVEIKRLTGDFQFVDRIGTDTQSLYIPLIKLEKSTLKFLI
jgi:hypothetical protein